MIDKERFFMEKSWRSERTNYFWTLQVYHQNFSTWIGILK